MGKRGNPNGSPQNLIPLNKRTAEERKEIARLGGLAAAENRKRKKSMKEWALLIGNQEITDINGNTMTRNGIIMYQQYVLAMQGDIKAAKFIADILGEYKDLSKPAQEIPDIIDIHID